MFFDRTCPSNYLIYLTECYSATNNILAKQKRCLHQRTIADSQKGKCHREPRPMPGTASLHHIFETDNFCFFSELPTLMLIACNLRNCCRVPIILNSVLSSLTRSLSWIRQRQIFLMQHSITRIASSSDVLLLGLKLKIYLRVVRVATFV